MSLAVTATIMSVVSLGACSPVSPGGAHLSDGGVAVGEWHGPRAAADADVCTFCSPSAIVIFIAPGASR